MSVDLTANLRISNLFTEILHSMESEEEAGVHWSTITLHLTLCVITTNVAWRSH